MKVRIELTSSEIALLEQIKALVGAENVSASMSKTEQEIQDELELTDPSFYLFCKENLQEFNPPTPPHITRLVQDCLAKIQKTR
jgi:hypothetical protein